MGGKELFVGDVVTKLLDYPATLLGDGIENHGRAMVNAPDLDALLRRVAQHDSAAFAELYDATRSRVYGMVCRVLRDHGYSEETTQDVYLQVWRTAESYDPASGSALAWLLTNVTDAVISGEDRQRVAACLNNLTDVQRECIELAYYQGMTYVQVSERLSANLATVKSRMRDGLRGLRNCLGVR
jgi:RNA polymerase sigma-70 factor (ECF subfamily)